MSDKVIQMLQTFRNAGMDWRQIGRALCVDPSEACKIYNGTQKTGKALERRYLDSFAVFSENNIGQLRSIEKASDKHLLAKRTALAPHDKWVGVLDNKNAPLNTKCWRHMAALKNLDTVAKLKQRIGLDIVRLYAILTGGYIPKLSTLGKHGMLMGFNATQVCWIMRECGLDARPFGKKQLTAAQYELLFNEKKHEANI